LEGGLSSSPKVDCVAFGESSLLVFLTSLVWFVRCLEESCPRKLCTGCLRSYRGYYPVMVDLVRSHLHMKNLESEYQIGELNHKRSNRILILAIVGILFLTLYPFRFSLHPNLLRHGSPFLLVSGMKTSGPFAALLNIALFVPFGFGLSQKLREKGKSGASVFGITAVAGALFSYGIEFTQIYVPTRDSGWEDVFTNTIGAAVGYLAFGCSVRPR
jgi:glycopeptide antibiotics resistance protein